MVDFTLSDLSPSKDLQKQALDLDVCDLVLVESRLKMNRQEPPSSKRINQRQQKTLPSVVPGTFVQGNIRHVDSGHVDARQVDTFADKLRRELFVTTLGITNGFRDGADQAFRQPLRFGAEMLGAVGLGLAVRGPSWLKIPALTVGSIGSLVFAHHTFRSLSATLSVLERTWQSSKNFEDNQLQLQQILGSLAFDSSCMLAGGLLASYLGKTLNLGESRLVTTEDKYTGSSKLESSLSAGSIAEYATISDSSIRSIPSIPSVPQLPTPAPRDFKSLNKQIGKVENIQFEFRSGLNEGLQVKPAIQYELMDSQGKLLGHVIVEKAYDKKLDVLRQERSQSTHEARGSLLPEDIAMHMEFLPDRRIQKVILYETANPQDLLRKKTDINFVSAAIVSGPGEISIFPALSSAPGQMPMIRRAFLHEWAHCLADGSENLLGKLNLSAEKGAVRAYGEEPGEFAAVNIGEGLFETNATSYLHLAKTAPIKNLLLAKSVRMALECTALSDRGLHFEKYLERARIFEDLLRQPATEGLLANPQNNCALILEIAASKGSALLKRQDTLNLNYSNSTDETLMQLAELCHFRRAELAGNKLSDHGIKSISEWKQLEHLDLRGTQITDRSLSIVSGFPNLSSLSLQGTAITDKGLLQLTKLQKLSNLNLSNTGISDRAVDSIKTHRALSRLLLENTALSDACIPALAQLKKLETINLYDTGVTQRGAMQLSQLLPACKLIY